MCTLFVVGHDKTLQVTCNQHTKIQVPTTATCILQKNYSRYTCSKANVHNPALNKLLSGLVFNATAHKELIVSIPHQRQAVHPNSSSNSAQNCTDKTIMKVKTTRIHVELSRASLCHGAFILKPSGLKLFVHPQAIHIHGICIRSMLQEQFYKTFIPFHTSLV